MSRKKRFTQPRNEFRDYKKSGHPAYIYQRVGKEFRFVGITHSAITSGMKNIPLDHNPNPADSRKSYFRPEARKDKTTSFGDIKRGWKLSPSDKEKVPRRVNKKPKRNPPRKPKNKK